MAKINTGTITAAGDGTWSSNAISLGAGAKRTYMYVNGVLSLTRDFTVAGISVLNRVQTFNTAGAGTTSVTSPSITASAGDKILVFVGTQGGIYPPADPGAVSCNAMSNVTWDSSFRSYSQTEIGYGASSTAVLTGSATGAVSGAVTATFSATDLGYSTIQVLVLKGVGSFGTAQKGTWLFDGVPRYMPSAAVTPASSASWFFAFWQGIDSLSTVTLHSNTVNVAATDNTSGYSILFSSGSSGTSGSIGTTSPSQLGYSSFTGDGRGLWLFIEAKV